MISPFAELEKSPEHMHTFRVTPLSLWNAASAGLSQERILENLSAVSRYGVPENVSQMIVDQLGRYGKIRLEATEEETLLKLIVDDPLVLAEAEANKQIAKCLIPGSSDGFYRINLIDRGTIKQLFIRIGYPVQDLAPLTEGEPLTVKLKSHTADGRPFAPRDYQKEAVSAFTGNGQPGNGFGTLVLPCGAGKTIVGIEAMAQLGTNTLILTTNVAAVHQWIDELMEKTELTREQIGEYTGDIKEIKPVTIATYQILVWRKDKESDFPHFSLFRKGHWGLIIYDEVHLLPAPIFRVTAEIQAVRRLGLTATLVREDGAEADVYSLVGPKRYDVPWKELEQKGWIAKAYCIEIRIDLPKEKKIPYATADKRQKFRIASENPLKTKIVRQLLENHPDDPTLVIGQYLDQLRDIAEELQAPLITGQTPNKKRDTIFKDFREGKTRVLIVSKVANFAINLPDASLAIQISGTFGSRQEEAQRLGRILRPKERNSYFYSLVSRYTTEETFAANRQKFLTEQGYKYQIEFWDKAELS